MTEDKKYEKKRIPLFRKRACFSLVSRRHIMLWPSFDKRNVLLCIPPLGASTYVLFTIMVCDEDTTENGSAMGGRGITAPNLTKILYSIQLKNRKIPCAVGIFSVLNPTKKSGRYLREPCVVCSRLKVYFLLLVSICNNLIRLKIILNL